MRWAFLLPVFVLGCADETISGYADPDATYSLIELNGSAFEQQATIKFPTEGRVEGTGPCNTWSARQTAPYPWIEMGPIAATRRACEHLELEAQFFDALARMSLAEVSGPVLVLSGENVEMVFQAN